MSDDTTAPEAADSKPKRTRAKKTADPATPVKKATQKKATQKKTTQKKAAEPVGPPAVMFQAPEPAPVKKAAKKKAAAAAGEKSADKPAKAAKPARMAEPAEPAKPARKRAPKISIEGGEPAVEPALAKVDAADEGDGGGPDGARKRRRRGRRGRGRGKGTGDALDTGDDTADEGESGAPAADSRGADDDAGDTDGEDGTGSTHRRRRRRRGGGGGGGAEVEPAPDDPERTVVRVREPRRVESEVRGVSGSTRLEAKRQRRRDGGDRHRGGVPRTSRVRRPRDARAPARGPYADRGARGRHLGRALRDEG